ncbi:MAG: dynamin family protein [Proteobacteria bacterium]|nr:dynamin family protein [Pseudomonadota bacterium]MBU1685783.1 dynamin family protein [Pseudomonadota bacterium]
MTDPRKLQQEIQKKVLARLGPLFTRYKTSPESLESVLKWKSIVLIIGNFSSGKSTLINELFAADIQRTGQSPTDDSFTILTAPAKGEEVREIPGPTLINDARLPFTPLKKHGEQFAAHFQMKLIDSPLLEHLAIIDSPGMLDAVSEKDRGYDYAGVIGDLAHLADLVVMMFDPHKAGTIGEVYDTIRNTLPENAGEDRLAFVLSRIDECDNPSDLVRSYGTLCWNLSQMTGRKDIPRIFMTYSPALTRSSTVMSGWDNERAELKESILAAPKLRINHILQHVDKQAQELRMIAEAMSGFTTLGRRLLAQTVKVSVWLACVLFLFADLILQRLTGFPETTLISSLLNRSAGLVHLLIPCAGVLMVTVGAGLFFSRWQLPRLAKRLAEMPDDLIDTHNEYRRQVWRRIRNRVRTLLAGAGIKDIRATHRKSCEKIDRFLNRDIQNYYRKGS